MSKEPPLFDHYAGCYEEALGDALKVSGENREFFATGRVAWLANWLKNQGLETSHLLDYGCGTGGSVAAIFDLLKPRHYLGVDVSEASLEIARATYPDPCCHFRMVGKPEPESFDLAFSNGVFHHIAPEERAGCLEWVIKSLKPGGMFALFENNSWNPATRYVMSRCRFDDDAIPLSPLETRSRMRQAGFEILTTRYLFVFPAFLSGLRCIEPWVSAMPFGTQYVTLGRKPVR